MNDRTKTGLAVLQVALIIGVLGDVLLRVTPWGANVFLFNAAFAAGMIMLIRRRAPQHLTGPTLALFGALVAFAAMFAWRDSIELRVADTFAILAILSVLFLPALEVPTRLAGVFHYGIAFIWAGINAFFAPIALLIADVDWKTIPRSRGTRHLFSVLRGIAIAAPLLLIFGVLFVAADAVYEGWVQRVLNIQPNIVLSHILLVSVFSWMSAGYLRGVLVNKAAAFADAAAGGAPDVSPIDNVRAESGEHAAGLPNNLSILEHINISDAPDPSAEPIKETPEEKKAWDWTNFENPLIPSSLTLGTVEIAIILGLTNLLFLSFVIVQVPYLFGGMDLVQNTPDFKLAEYARRGFGELVAVSALVLPMLLASHWLIRKENPFSEKLFRVLAGINIVLLFVIMASAVQRLVLLTGSLGYGMTTIRLYPMIFMSWLAIVFIWFGFTVLRGMRKHFAWGALWSAFLILGATHLLNPDAFIVETNVKLMEQGREFDARYNSDLSDDAVPALLRSIPSMTTEDQCEVKSKLRDRRIAAENEGDLRSWNWSRAAAFDGLNQTDLQTTGCPATFAPYSSD